MTFKRNSFFQLLICLSFFSTFISCTTEEDILSEIPHSKESEIGKVKLAKGTSVLNEDNSNLKDDRDKNAWEGIGGYEESADSIQIPNSDQVINILDRRIDLYFGQNVSDNYNQTHDDDQDYFNYEDGFFVTYTVNIINTFHDPTKEETNNLELTGSIMPIFISKPKELFSYPDEVFNYYSDEKNSLVKVSISEVNNQYIMGTCEGSYIDYYTGEEKTIKAEFKVDNETESLF